MRKEDRRVGVREELLLDVAKTDEAGDSDRNKSQNHKPAQAQRVFQKPAIGPEKQAAILIDLCTTALLKEVVPKQRGDRQGQYPAQ